MKPYIVSWGLQCKRHKGQWEVVNIGWWIYLRLYFKIKNVSLKCDMIITHSFNLLTKTWIHITCDLIHWTTTHMQLQQAQFVSISAYPIEVNALKSTFCITNLYVSLTNIWAKCDTQAVLKQIQKYTCTCFITGVL